MEIIPALKEMIVPDDIFMYIILIVLVLVAGADGLFHGLSQRHMPGCEGIGLKPSEAVHFI